MVGLQKCPICGGKISQIHGPIEWDVKGEPIVVDDVTYDMCCECGESYFAGGLAGEIHRRAVDQYKRDNGLLSGDEVRELRQGLGLSQAKFEKLIGAGPKTVVRWENGSVFQNRTADTLMRVVRDFPEVAAYLMERVDEPRTS
ncbi:type II toxin-antitoxin system MqsA family antitoxin [Arabiibacter massiliensis]|uniref:type II toxin-antitoxin system MqsA family antitoxin n=1 Tax=Arabiibacter massiliensis TaxID=1870985 RepID=UPI0009BAAE13|nr:type II toxin-antitoxin system MqsA family antitoxin [Arabiibacter massiliensis]